MSRHASTEKPIFSDDDVKGMRIETDSVAHPLIAVKQAGVADIKAEDKLSPSSSVSSLSKGPRKSATSMALKQSSTPQSPSVKAEYEQVVGGDVTVKLESGQPPKLSRAASRKIFARPPPLYLDLPDATPEAVATFEQISKCIYSNKYLGSTDHALECDCAEEWGKFKVTNLASINSNTCPNCMRLYTDTVTRCIGSS